MKIAITSIRLKSPFKFFVLSYKAMGIMQQLKKSKCVAMKKRGFWTMHYTMTSWENEKDMKDFAGSGAHLEAMKETSKIAHEVKSVTIDANDFPDWKTAKQMLNRK